MPTIRKRTRTRGWTLDCSRIRILLQTGHDFGFIGPAVPYAEGEIPEDVLRKAWAELRQSIIDEHKATRADYERPMPWAHYQFDVQTP